MRYVMIAILMMFFAGIAIAAEIDESQYIKDTVPVENTYACQIGNTSACEVPVLLDKANKKVEYYWSTAENKWIGAGDQQAILQALYDKREDIRGQRQLKRMQDEINKRRREDMSEKMYEEQGGHR